MPSTRQVAPTLPPFWDVSYSSQLPARQAAVTAIHDLDLHPLLAQSLRQRFPRGIYTHQHEAIRRMLAGENVCLATSTASGKTLAFSTVALQRLLTDPNSRVMAIYPQKSLANEQERRWNDALEAVGMRAAVGRIDGSVEVGIRAELLRTRRVIVMTPDVMHAWFFSHLAEATVRDFLRNTSLVVVDEVHTYTGVLGSNAAYLFRRLQHAAALLNSRLQFFSASATIREPIRHLLNLFGLPFSLIGPEADESPKQPVAIQLLTPARAEDFLTELTVLLRAIIRETDSRFIAFVDSRKQTEQIASILSRQDVTDSDETEASDELSPLQELLEVEAVLPYRAGLEEVDRKMIEKRLANGSLRGVVSTSALELGIDIRHLDVAVLIGVPRSSTSLHQRIGRIGRNRPGHVYVINSGTVYDEAVFRAPEELLKRPPAEGALYLANPRIQYVHALCLARPGGEHDQLSPAGGANDSFQSEVSWPLGFMELCQQEKTGQISGEFQGMKAESGDNPNYAFPLRDVERQFKVEMRMGPARQACGTLSYAQLMREAYPGAVYYHAMQTYRVTSISLPLKTVLVRREKRYTTSPTKLPSRLFPNLTPGNVHRAFQYNSTTLIECSVQVSEAVLGFKERRGRTELLLTYPTDNVVPGLRFSGPRFSRIYFTTGVLITHPSLNVPGVDTETLASLLFEALLMTAPFERQDIGSSAGKIAVPTTLAPKDSRYIALFDQTYGSLRLSGRIFDPGVFSAVMTRTIELLSNADSGSPSDATITAARAILESSLGLGANLSLSEQDSTTLEHSRARVIMPGSVGINTGNANEEFIVSRVIVNPRLGGLSYVGRHATTKNSGQSETIPAHQLVAIQGESEEGYYDYETGDVSQIRD